MASFKVSFRNFFDTVVLKNNADLIRLDTTQRNVVDIHLAYKNNVKYSFRLEDDSIGHMCGEHFYKPPND